MKRILFIVITLLTFNTVYAFDIDVEKINVGSRSDSLTKELDSSYKIDVEDFDYSILNDEAAVKLVKNLINITSSKKEESEKIKEYTKLMYLPSDNGTQTLSGVLFRDTYFSELRKYDIKEGYVSNVKTVPFNDDVLAFAYLKDTKVNDKKSDVVFTYWLKKIDGEYKVYYPWLTVGEKLNDYFNRLAKEEDSGDIIGDTYNSMSLEGNGAIMVEDDVIEKLYQKCKGNIVQITGMSDTGSNMYGSGFFIREGVIVTTWSLMQQFLSDSNYMYVNDVNGDTYNVEGIIAAQVDYDVVVLKLNKNVGTPVKFRDSKGLKLDDKVFTINSKNNMGFSVNYGTYISLENGRLKNLMAISSSEVGSALFDVDGNVVGFNVKDQLYSELSYANSTNYLRELQDVLNKQDFNKIKYTNITDFKDRYYLNFTEEKEYSLVPDKIWNKYKKVGNLEDNIKLKLVKASYTNNILSLRYHASSGESIDSIYLVSNYINELRKNGYELIQETDYMKVYENQEYQVIIKESFNYLIVLVMEK